MDRRNLGRQGEPQYPLLCILEPTMKGGLLHGLQERQPKRRKQCRSRFQDAPWKRAPQAQSHARKERQKHETFGAHPTCVNREILESRGFQLFRVNNECLFAARKTYRWRQRHRTKETDLASKVMSAKEMNSE